MPAIASQDKACAGLQRQVFYVRLTGDPAHGKSQDPAFWIGQT